MTDTTKLLYIFPDVAYMAELSATKSGTSFAIQSFHQINGQFLTAEQFLNQSIDKLFAKLDKGRYRLVLPDLLFTNTIVNIKATKDEEIVSYLKNSLLPSLGLNAQDYHLDTTILTTLAHSAKVQLTAIEKSLLAPIRVFAQKHQVEIASISPLTWTLKSVVSLEPSISLVQLGESVYAGMHYIGVDQTNTAKLDELEILAETIKTLKGSEPNIQTIYLISNSLVESRLQAVLSTTIPVQQLVTNRESDTKIPPYIKFAIEATARSLNITDYPVPKFELDPPSDEEAEAVYNQTVHEPVRTTETPMKTEEVEPQTTTATATTVDKIKTTTSIPKKINLETKQGGLPKPKTLKLDSDKEVSMAKSITTTNQDQASKVEKAGQTKPVVDQPNSVDDVDLSQFAYGKKTEKLAQAKGGSKMLKMIFITLAVFFATVAVGAGIGFGLLTLTNRAGSQTETPTTAVTPAVSPTETPTPTPEALAKPLSVLVVNATKKAGYAGTTKSKLLKANQDAETKWVKTVTAGNAQGEYDKPSDTGTQLLLMKEKNDTVKTALEKATGFKLEYADGVETEDSQAQYDAVIVLVQ